MFHCMPATQRRKLEGIAAPFFYFKPFPFSFFPLSFSSFRWISEKTNNPWWSYGMIMKVFHWYRQTDTMIAGKQSECKMTIYSEKIENSEDRNCDLLSFFAVFVKKRRKIVQRYQIAGDSYRLIITLRFCTKWRFFFLFRPMRAFGNL